MGKLTINIYLRPGARLAEPSELSNSVELFNSLTIGELESRLAEVVAEGKALKTLLRSLRAKERARRRKAAILKQKEVADV